MLRLCKPIIVYINTMYTDYNMIDSVIITKKKEKLLIGLITINILNNKAIQ